MRSLINLVLIFLIPVFSLAQIGKEAYEAEFNARYQENIENKEIRGIYIPASVSEALLEFDRILEDDVKEHFKNFPDSSAAGIGVNTIGRWFLTNWNLYEGSRIAHLLKIEKGLSHPIDMCYYLLEWYHAELNDREINEEELLQYILVRRRQIFKQQVGDQVLDSISIE